MRHTYLYKGRSLPRFLDIFFWPVVTILTWGFLSVYLEGANLSSVNFISVILGAVIFWEIVQRSQQAISIYFLEDVWEKNFLNIFVTPLTLAEFFTASFILGVIRIIITTTVLFLIALFMYNFNLFSIGLPLLPYVVNLFLFGVVVALFINAIILRFGTSAQVLAFGLIFIIQPICAIYYPLSALPTWIQPISLGIPITHVFEAMRATMRGEAFNTESFLIALILNIVYLVIVWFFFKGMFASVKKKGLLLKVQN
ncbi:MAG: ABC transporter permease [Candidatus Paceibacterota bacterium]|jgi:ABC-2 type transport system permease protein